jgi:hypothetical protein
VSTRRHFCPNCDAVHRPSDRFCAYCGAPVEKRPPRLAQMLLAYLVCAPLAWGLTLFMMGLNDDPSDTHTSAEWDAAIRPATEVAIVVALVGAVVLLIPLARRRLGIRTIWRAVLILDGAVAASTVIGFVVALG